MLTMTRQLEDILMGRAPVPTPRVTTVPDRRPTEGTLDADQTERRVRAAARMPRFEEDSPDVYDDISRIAHGPLTHGDSRRSMIYGRTVGGVASAHVGPHQARDPNLWRPPLGFNPRTGVEEGPGRAVPVSEYSPPDVGGLTR